MTSIFITSSLQNAFLKNPKKSNPSLQKLKLHSLSVDFYKRGTNFSLQVKLGVKIARAKWYLNNCPNGHNPEWAQSRMETIPNGHDPKWTPSGMCMIPNGYRTEWAPSQMDTIPNGHDPKWTRSQMNTIQNEHDPE